MINKLACPFCKTIVEVKHYRKRECWVCGCFNEECKIRPTTLGMDTEDEAMDEWLSAFKGGQVLCQLRNLKEDINTEPKENCTEAKEPKQKPRDRAER